MGAFDYLKQDINKDEIKKFNDNRANQVLNQNFKPTFLKEDDITILSELELYIRKQKPEELEQFKASLEEEGIRDALVVTLFEGKNVLVDGHHRFRVGKEVGITYFPTKQLALGTLEDIKIWMLKNQLGRRNLTDAERIYIATELTNFLTEKAKENQQSGVRLNLAKGEKAVNTNAEIAKLANVSRANVTKFNKLKKEASAEELEKVIIGEKSIHKAHSDLKKSAEVDLKQTNLQDELDTKGSKKPYHGDMVTLNNTIRSFEDLMSKDDKKAAKRSLDEMIKLIKSIKGKI
ncbi:ParB/RepB/Spo0J family partition protein [Chondrinema litorale]|uniref:ParB/RepB/Spo0J family partition protein n=1 Tax=Chondrinema litorale TaxID=2994555 RepID=UPI002543AC8B|nr:ParB N-terminal domain-containing protein [Chondrinema litorale]UZS00230.1 ParB N-terminal domain-containing protein [Chondrinema litorale]